MGGGVGRSAVTASEGKLTLMKSGRKKQKERQQIKEETFALVHLSLILEEMLEAIKGAHQKQLLSALSDGRSLRGAAPFEDRANETKPPPRSENIQQQPKTDEESDTTTLLASHAD